MRLLLAALALLMLGGLFFGVMQTPPAKRFMAARLTATLSAKLPWPVEVRGIGGLLPFVATVESVRLGEAGDPWLELNGAIMNLNAFPLARGQVAIERIGADTLTLHRLPESEDADETEVRAPLALPVLSDLPGWIWLGQLAVDRITIGEDVLGRTVAFDVGGAYLPWEEEAVRIDVRGLDDLDAGVSLSGSLKQGVVALRMEARDATLLPAFAGLEAPFALTLAIDGPLSGAAVTLEAKRGDERLASLDATVAYPDPLHIEGTAFLAAPPDLLPPAVRERFGEEFNLDLNMTLGGGNDLTLAETRVDFGRGALTLSGTYALSTGMLDLAPVVTYDDFHHLTGQVAPGDPVGMTAHIPVQGTREQLTLQPSVSVGGEPFLSGDLSLGLGELLAATGDITVHPAVATTPVQFQDLLAEGAALSLDMTYGDGDARFQNTHLRVGKTAIVVTGTANTGNNTLDMTLKATASDLHEFEGLAGLPLAGAGSIELTAKGDATRTTVQGVVRVENLTANTLTAPAGELQVDLIAGGFPDTLADRIESTISGSFPGFQPQPDLARDLTLNGGIVLEARQRLQVTDLDISDGNLALRANGTVNLESRTADFNADMRAAQFGDYTAIANLPYRGAADLTLHIASGEAPGSLVANLQGSLSALDGLPAAADGLLGEDVALTAQGQYDGARAALTAFTLAGGGLRAEGSGDFTPETKQINAEVEGAIADLAPLSGVAGRPLSGAAEFTLEASGPRDAIAARGTINGQDLNLDVLLADTATITVDATGLPSAIAATVAASLEQSGETLTLDTRIALAESRLDIGALELVAGGNRLSGAGVFDLARNRGHGELSVDAQDLSTLETWVKRPLTGRIALDATLAKDTGVLIGQFDAADLVADTLRLTVATGTFNVDDVFGAPSGTIEVNATDFEAGEFHLEALSFTAAGPPSGMDLNLTTAGVLQGYTPFNLSAGGRFSNETVAFDLRDLDFGVEGFSFALQAPATLSWQEDTAVLSPLRLQGDSGALEAAGQYTTEAIDARVAWTDVSLRLVELAGIEPMDGAVSGTLALTGTPESPRIDAKMSVAGYRRELDNDDVPGLDARLTADFSDGALSAELTASVERAADFQARAGIPVTLRLAPWQFEIAQDAAFTGTLQGTADLAAIAPLLPMEGHALRGQLDADISARGTRSAPRLDGAITVADGYYENGGTSTILNELAMTVRAEGDTLRLTEFSANDTAGGTFSGEGYMAFRPEDGSPFEFKLALDRPRLVYRDDLRADGGGELHLTGNASGALLQGDLAIGPAYITTPEGSAETEVTTVAFTETQAAGESETETREEMPYRVDLDLTIDLPGKIFVSGPGLDSEWEGNFRVRNTATEPAVEGQLRVRKGTLDFLGRLFNLAESTVTFDGQSPPAPYLRIVAVTETKDVLARVRMEGVADSLNITLESEPTLPQDEILSRVLFGQRLSDVSPVQALTLARYAPMFNRKQSGRSILGSGGPKPFLVDRVSLRSGTGVGDASIATGKYLSEDFYLEFEQGLGAAESLVSLDWIFAPRWSLRGKTTSQGQGGLGVFWKKDY